MTMAHITLVNMFHVQSALAKGEKKWAKCLELCFAVMVKNCI